jgi:hypothetical protein
MRRIDLVLTASALALALTSGAALAKADAPAAGPGATPMPVEYAVRWNVHDGGPQSAKDTLAALGQPAGDPDDYEVQYFAITPPKDAPAEFQSILRQRTKGQKKHELTFKYRGDHELSSWACPLSATPAETKGEVDVSILASGGLKRVYSYSCTLESKAGPIRPAPALEARAKGCIAKMSRLKAGKLKVEEWHLPGEIVMVEVSRNGADTPIDLQSFQSEVVDRLVRAGVKPSDRSKTELGSDCQ